MVKQNPKLFGAELVNMIVAEPWLHFMPLGWGRLGRGVVNSIKLKRGKNLQYKRLKAKIASDIKVGDAEKAREAQRALLGDVPEFMGMSNRAFGDMASESVALKTMNKKFFSTLRKELGRSRAKTATGLRTIRQTKKEPKLAVTKAKSKGALKSYKAATVKSENVFRKTMEKFTMKSKASPFAMRTAKVKKSPMEQGAAKRMGLDDREYFNPKSGKTFINTVRGDRFKKK